VLQAVLTKCDQLGHSADPTTVVCDFEQAAINAATAKLGQHVKVHGSFYHLTQSTWRKVQELGLTAMYRENQEFKHYCGMLDGLAFLPLQDVAAGMAFLRSSMPTVDRVETILDLVSYFDSTYVTGPSRLIRRPAHSHRVQRLHIRKLPPIFQPAVWNVHDATLSETSRTNNFCESWNNGFRSLVGHQSISHMIQYLITARH